MKPTQVLLLGATLDSDNRGIGALAMGALSILVHRYPGCEIHFVDYGKTPTTTMVPYRCKRSLARSEARSATDMSSAVDDQCLPRDIVGA